MLDPIRRRILFWAPVALILMGSLAWLLVPRPVAVDVAMVGSGPMQVTLSEEGEARVRDVFMISAPVSATRPTTRGAAGSHDRDTPARRRAT